MPRGPSEETAIYQVRVAQRLDHLLQEEAANDGNRPLAHLLREIVEDHLALYNLPPTMVDMIEADRAKKKQTKREYMLEMLDKRYRELLGAKPAPKK